MLLVNASTILQHILFADDTNALLSRKVPDCVVNQLNIGLNKLSIWFKVNKLIKQFSVLYQGPVITTLHPYILYPFLLPTDK